MIIHHNPRCSKSRQALALLKENGVEPEVVEYLKKPMDESALRGLLTKLGLKAHDILRTKEGEYKQLGLSPDTPEEEILVAIVQDPILLERPIIVKGNRAIIGRPPENVRELL